MPPAPGTSNAHGGFLGSGVILEARGLILTNNHVIADADDIMVVTADGREFPGRVLGTDPSTDLAVVEITPGGLRPATLRPNPLRVGDTVLAIGNPFGLGQTVSQGIVSALGRQTLGTSPYADFIQTDAAINPGNSGGALIDSEGALVGINTLIFSRSGSFEGIGFALPAALALEVAQEIESQGQVIRGWLGLDVTASADGAGLMVSGARWRARQSRGTPPRRSAPGARWPTRPTGSGTRPAHRRASRRGAAFPW